jgi:hypothetical protein
MRHPLAIAAGLILGAATLVPAQEAAEKAATSRAEALSAARAELDSLRKELATLQESCGVKPSSSCATAAAASATRTLILKRYSWVPASSVGFSSQVAVNSVVAPSVGTVGVTTVQPGAFAVQAAPLVTSGFAPASCSARTLSTGILTTNHVAVQSFAPTSTNGVLPASPYQAHQSYGAYSHGAVTQSMGAASLGAARPVYPTEQFRGTAAGVNYSFAPYYAAY